MQINRSRDICVSDIEFIAFSLKHHSINVKHSLSTDNLACLTCSNTKLSIAII